MTQPSRTPPGAVHPFLLPAPVPAPETKKRFRPLTPKQQAFIDEYLVDLNARQAAVRAGYKGGPGMGSQHFLVRNPKIAEAIRTALDERAERLKITAERVLLELARVAFSDIGRIGTWDDTGFAIAPSAKLAANDRAAISEITTFKNRDGATATRVKLHDKQRALKILALHLRLYGRFADPPHVESPAAAADRARALILERLARLRAVQEQKMEAQAEEVEEEEEDT
jgi:phage terminase small subunit